MKNQKYRFRSNGDLERGKRIIKALEKLEGINFNIIGNAPDGYYYYIKDEHIRCSREYPSGYVLAEPEDILNERVYPREMYVSDSSKEEGVNVKRLRTVISEYEYKGISYFIALSGDKTTHVVWRYAVDIPKESKVAELTLNYVAAKLNAVIDKLNIQIDKIKIRES